MKKQKERKPRQPMTKQRRRELVIWLAAVAVFLIASILVGSPGRSETVQETMRDAVLHETNRVSLFGIKDVNPGLISAMLVSAFLLVAAALIRNLLGLGSLMVLSINSRDYPVIMGITVFIAAAVLIGNMIVDLVYGLLDPKIRYS